MNNKLTSCTTCQTEIASTAKTCPKCGAENKQKGSFSKIKIAVGCFIAVIIIAAMAKGGKEGVSSGASISEPEISDSAMVIALIYDNNKIAGDTKYKGRTTRVAGDVVEITETLGSVNIVLKGSEQNDIQCILPDSERKKAASLSKGQFAMMQGKVLGLGPLGGIVIDKCILIDEAMVEKKEPFARLTWDEFIAKMRSTDTAEQYKFKVLEITGEVTEIGMNQFEKSILLCFLNSDKNLLCKNGKEQLSKLGISEAGKLPVHRQIRIKGVYENGFFVTCSYAKIELKP